MPIRLAAHTKFKWQTDDTTGYPLAAVASFGAVCYVMVCPLCGCFHELSGQIFDTVGQEATLTPRCMVREFAGQPCGYGYIGGPWSTIYGAWVEQHPAAVDHDSVRAVFVGVGADLKGGYALSVQVIPKRRKAKQRKAAA